MQCILFILLEKGQSREHRTKYGSTAWRWFNGGPALRYLHALVRNSSQVYSIVWCLVDM